MLSDGSLPATHSRRRPRLPEPRHQWHVDAFELDGPAFIHVDERGMGGLQFIAVHGHLDGRFGEFAGNPLMEFTWAGEDEGDEVCGRGRAVLMKSDLMMGEIFIHCGMDSGFVAEKMKKAPTPKARSSRRAGS